MMKKVILCLALTIVTALQTIAQQVNVATGVKKAELPVVYLPDNVSVHFISPEPIQYVDISTKAFTGDLPLKNVLRIKHISDSVLHRLASLASDAVVTIVGEKYIAQYHVVFSPDENGDTIQTDIDILQEQMRPIDLPGISLSVPELKGYAMKLLSRKPEKHLEKSKAYGLKANLNHLYTLGDYIFLDVGYENKTKLRYAIDEIRFKIEDKKVTKATTVQSLEIKPDFTLFDIPAFKKHYRNIFVFKKFTFPGNKLLDIELSEQQLSGRVITLHIPYKDVLEADQIPMN